MMARLLRAVPSYRAAMARKRFQVVEEGLDQIALTVESADDGELSVHCLRAGEFSTSASDVALVSIVSYILRCAINCFAATNA